MFGEEGGNAHNICRFHILMHDASCVVVRERRENLTQETDDLFLSKRHAHVDTVGVEVPLRQLCGRDGFFGLHHSWSLFEGAGLPLGLLWCFGHRG